MSELHFPWLALSILTPLLSALWVNRLRDADEAHKWSAVFSGVTLAFTVGAWQDFFLLGASQASDGWDLLSPFLGWKLLVIDEFSAPLLPLTALLYLLTAIATLKTKIRRFSFAGTLVTEAVVLALLSCQEPWAIIVLLALPTVPPYLELQARNRPTRVYVLHMAIFVGLMILGWAFVEAEGRQRTHSLWAVLPLLAAILIRSGIAPLHCWITDLFEHATFGTALLFVTPIVGAYSAVRLVLPIAPDWVLRSIGLISLATAVYASGMALVQHEARRFFCYLFLSHSSLVLVGLESATPIGLTGALCVWISVGLSLGGFGLTLRALEARFGRLALTDFLGLYEHTPALAVCFAITGLASVGFPGTIRFIGTELLVDGVVEIYPHVGVAVALATALNGIAVVRSYFILFTGTRYVSSVSLRPGLRERFAVLTLAMLIFGGGLFPQPSVESRNHAAAAILRERAKRDPSLIDHEVPEANPDESPPMRSEEVRHE
jgi:NADH-quinone oxidoreductase subunit M